MKPMRLPRPCSATFSSKPDAPLFPFLDLSLQTVALMAPDENDVFCISALPPFAFSRARALSRQLHLRFPQTKTIIGVWGFAGDADGALQRFKPALPAKLVTSLADAVKFVIEGEPAVVLATVGAEI